MQMVGRTIEVSPRAHIHISYILSYSNYMIKYFAILGSITLSHSKSWFEEETVGSNIDSDSSDLTQELRYGEFELFASSI